jgi:methionyl-tRNA formyltransferase
MPRTLDGLAAGTLAPHKQNNAEATLAPILTKEDGCIDFKRSAQKIFNRWRGFQPWPGAWTMLHGKKLTIGAMQIAAETTTLAPGTVIAAKDTLLIACGAGSVLACTALQFEGRKRMDAPEFLRGVNISSGERLG